MKEDEQKVLIAAATAGALGLAGVFAWRQLTRTKQGAAPGAVRVGIIGTGWGVKVQLPQFRRAGLEVTAIASRSQDTAVTIAATHHIASPYDNVISLCQSPDVDLVSVVSPAYLHAEQMIAALVGGKHVLVDKPMAVNAAEGERMLAAASAHSKQVAIIDHELRFVPSFQRARELLLDGAIGTVLDVECIAVMPGLGGEWTWWSDAVSGGGALGAIGSHVIDMYRFMLDAEFSAVSARVETIVKERKDKLTGKPRAATADDYCSVSFTLEPRRSTEAAPLWGATAGDGSGNGSGSILGHFTVGLVGSTPVGSSEMRMYGSRGSLVISFADSSLKAVGEGGKEIASVAGKGNGFAVVGTHALGVGLQRALGPEKDGSALQHAATVADGLAVMYVMDAIRSSGERQGAWESPKHVQLD